MCINVQAEIRTIPNMGLLVNNQLAGLAGKLRLISLVMSLLVRVQSVALLSHVHFGGIALLLVYDNIPTIFSYNLTQVG